MKKLSQEERDHWLQKFRALSNSARYEEAHALARKLLKQHPREILFAHYEAVMFAEGGAGSSPAELSRRYRSAARKLRKLLRRSRAIDPKLRKRVRNEYYWFSQQPRKQYRLGQELVRAGDRASCYSMGVGAAQLAKQYAQKRKKGLSLRWARKSEQAWLGFFRTVPRWYNSYLFYGAALGYQGRLREMDAAFAKAARIAGKPKGWKAIRQYRAEVEQVRNALERA